MMGRLGSHSPWEIPELDRIIAEASNATVTAGEENVERDEFCEAYQGFNHCTSGNLLLRVDQHWFLHMVLVWAAAWATKSGDI
jgi:hypothetical protein